MKKAIIYGYFDLTTEDCVYIGIDTNMERHANHLKPSKKNKQVINTWLQDRIENTDWTYVVLDELYSLQDVKTKIHLLETYYINLYNPKFNVYKKVDENE